MAKRIKKGILSDKIADVLSTTPGSLDPEDDIYEETKARVIENEYEENENEDVTTSQYRKQNVSLLEDVDQRYKGKKGSRKSLKDSDEDWETDEDISTDGGEALDGVPGTMTVADSDEDDDSNSEEERNSENEASDDYEKNDKNEGKFHHLNDTNLSNQVKKGNCVRNQLSIWENLLEMRIQLQKCLLTSNKFPQHDIFVSLNTDQDFKTAVDTTKKNLTNILDKFLLLQSVLLKQFRETKSLLKDKKSDKKIEKEESDEEIPSDTEDEDNSSEESEIEEDVPIKRLKTAEYENKISIIHSKYKPYRNSVIQKWNEKTRMGVGKSSGATNTVLQQIDYILGDRTKLIKRTQLKRAEYDIVGKNKPQTEDESSSTQASNEYDTEIYDDNDFYHQLLRELIEFKSGDVTDPVQISRQWIALQNLRSKMKRKIDTKATKGRKIRYVVHSKLVNFMAPIDQNQWTDEAKNELYGSLFGTKQTSTITT